LASYVCLDTDRSCVWTHRKHVNLGKMDTGFAYVQTQNPHVSDTSLDTTNTCVRTQARWSVKFLTVEPTDE